MLNTTPQERLTIGSCDHGVLLVRVDNHGREHNRIGELVVGAPAGKFVLFDEVGREKTLDLVRRDLAIGGARSDTQFDLSRFLIVNAGWTGIYQSDAQLIVFLRPAKVAPAALSGALYWVADAAGDGHGHGTLVILDGANPTSLQYPNRHALLQAVCDAVNDAQPSHAERFARRVAQRAELASDSPLLGLANIWHELNGRLDIERMWRLLHGGLGRRFIMLSTDPDAMRVKSFGGGFDMLPSYWASDMRGVRVRDQPDLAYGKWIENAYREADATDYPLIEAIDCEVDWPREGLRCHRYWRVMVPFELDGQRIVLGATMNDTGISLRSRRGPVTTVSSAN